MPLDHSRLQELFLAACDLPKSKQDAFIDDRCADDPVMRHELELLLRTDARGSGILADGKTTAEFQVHFDQTAEPEIPKYIGRYQVKRILGEGGMGVVYLAEQKNPSREVAVKVIRPAFADKQTIARFEAERQALSMMDHPNIARVLDAGETEEGMPFFVMEAVQGDPITRYCDDNKLTPGSRLELFVQACDAIQHAHQKGIIHRDLKPSNILVSVHEGEPRVKVIDFGLAKALAHQTKLTDKTVLTELGRVVGTVQYMSPEQARLDSLDIDTRTDIYSLGVILYELLAGSTPLEKDSLEKHALLHVLGLIREKEPQRPSDRLSSTVESRDSISAQRQIQPAKLQQILRGELDWIIMHAIEKDRTRRYASPNDFADDVRRYLNGEAVEARPPSSVYRMRKFVRKNRVAVGVFAGVLALICTATAAVVSYAVRADASAKRSDAILKIVAESFQSVNPVAGADAQMSAKDVLIKAYESLDDSDLDDTGKRDLLRQLNGSFLGIGEIDLSIQIAEEWRTSAERDLGADHSDTLDAARSLALAYLAGGRSKESIALSENILSIRKPRLGANHLKTLDSQDDLARGYCDAGRFEEAINLFEQTLSLRELAMGAGHPGSLRCMNQLAGSYQVAERYDDALELYERTFKVSKEELGDDHVTTLAAMTNVALGCLDVDRVSDAIELSKQSLKQCQAKLGPDHPLTLVTLYSLGKGYSDGGDAVAAVELYEQALPAMQAKFGPDHPNTYGCMTELAISYRRANRFEDAIKLREETLKLYRANLGRDHPSTIHSMKNLARDHRAAGHHEEALKIDVETIRLRQAKLGHDDLKTLQAVSDLVWNLLTTGMEAHIDDWLIEELRRASELTKKGYMMGTLAVAEYRLENFSEAIKVANLSVEKLPPPTHPINFAILAMSHRRLDHEKEQTEFREAFNQAMQSEAFKNDPDCQKFAVELDGLFGAEEE